MKVHQKVAAVLVSSLGLVAWGCSGDDVESGVNKTGDGIESAGKATGSGIKAAGEKIKDAGAGGKMENAANATGTAISKGGEKIISGTEKLGEEDPRTEPRAPARLSTKPVRKVTATPARRPSMEQRT